MGPDEKRWPSAAPVCLMLYVAAAVLRAEVVDVSSCSTSFSVLMHLTGYPVFLSVLLLIWNISTNRYFSWEEDPSHSYEFGKEECLVCHAPRPVGRRTHHCKTCRRCVVDHDHHCGVLGVCIWGRNMWHFRSILLLGCAGHVVLALTARCNGGSILGAIQHLYQAVPGGPREVVGVFIEEAKINFFYWCYLGGAGCTAGFYIMFIILGDSNMSFASLVRMSREGKLASSLMLLARSSCRSASGRSAGCLSSLHELLDLSRPGSLCGVKYISASTRWRLNCLVPIPFAIFAVQKFLDESTGPFDRVTMLLVVPLMVMATYYQRAVCLGYTASVTAPSTPGLFHCTVCDRSFSMQDHHCGGFGTCIHRGNRDPYIKFSVIAAICFLAYVPHAWRYTISHVHFTWGMDIFGFPWRRQLVELLLPLLVLNCTLGGLMFFSMCSMQQLSYLHMDRIVRANYSKRHDFTRLDEISPIFAAVFSIAFRGEVAARFIRDVLDDEAKLRDEIYSYDDPGDTEESSGSRDTEDHPLLVLRRSIKAFDGSYPMGATSSRGDVAAASLRDV